MKKSLICLKRRGKYFITYPKQAVPISKEHKAYVIDLRDFELKYHLIFRGDCVADKGGMYWEKFIHQVIQIAIEYKEKKIVSISEYLNESYDLLVWHRRSLVYEMIDDLVKYFNRNCHFDSKDQWVGIYPRTRTSFIILKKK